MYFNENKCLIRHCLLYLNESPIIISQYNSMYIFKNIPGRTTFGSAVISS